MSEGLFKGWSVRWAMLSVLIFSVGALLTGYYRIENSNLVEELKAERIHAESLLKSKVILQKREKALMQENIELAADKQKAATLASQQLAHLRSTQASQLQKKNAEIEALRSVVQDAQNENTLIRKNADVFEEEIDQLRQEKSELQLAEAHARAELQTNKKPKASYFRIEALKKKNHKETNLARKTAKILVSFTWPEASKGKNIYLVLSGPDGKVIGNPAKEQVSILLDGTHEYISPLISRQLQIDNNSQRQEVLLDVPNKLKGGMYQADVYTDDFHLGGTQIRLE